MHKVGLSFRSPLDSVEVLQQYIRPLRTALEQQKLGIYSNYLRQIDPDENKPTEHLLVFQVSDFKQGLRCLRMETEKLGMSDETTFHNLDPSQPGY